MHSRAAPRWRLPSLLVCLLTLFGHRVVAEEVVTIRLQDGRSLAARLDPRSDDTRLWLRSGAGSISIRRPVDWSVVASAERDGRPLTVEQLRQLAAEIAAEVERSDPPSDDDSPPDMPNTGLDPLWPKEASALHARSRSPVVSVEADACAANWDADVEVDGLVVHVVARDRFGEAVAVNGTLEVELHALRGGGRNTPRHGLASLRRVGTWSQALSEGDFGPHGASVRLPYQAWHPQFIDASTPYGLVQVRLTVPGDGVFAAACDDVRLRPYSALRDAQERATGRRFLPHEHTSRPRR
jgi:hypothetical protein